MEYLCRHPIVSNGGTEVENNVNGKDEMEAEKEFVFNQSYGRFEFNQANGSVKRYIERATPRKKVDQSQYGIHMR